MTGPIIKIAEFDESYLGIPGVFGRKGKLISWEVTTQPRSAVATGWRADGPWLHGDATGEVQRLWGVPCNFVNIGDQPLDFGNAWGSESYFAIPGSMWPAIRDFWSVSLDSATGESYTFQMKAAWWSDYIPAIAGLTRGNFCPWHAGLTPGFGTIDLDPWTSASFIDISGVVDGDYTMVVSTNTGSVVSHDIHIEALSVQKKF